MKIRSFFHNKAKAETGKCSQKEEPCVSEDVVQEASVISQCAQDLDEFTEEQWVKEERNFNEKDTENGKSKGG